MVMYSLDRIVVGEGRRAVVEATVLSLMQSIREIGLLHPITVQKIGDEIHLVAGRNRLEAFKRLGTHDKIPAVLIEVSARIAELDELGPGLFRDVVFRLVHVRPSFMAHCDEATTELSADPTLGPALVSRGCENGRRSSSRIRHSMKRLTVNVTH